MEETEQEEKLGRFLEWLQANKVELRGCEIKYSDETKGFGIFSTSAPPPPPPSDVHNGGGRVLLVVPLDLAITPMRVLQDPLIGPECRAMFEEGEVDDRFLIILFLLLERLKKHSSWKPYLDMLPSSFGNPLWFTDEELLELKGTALYRATELQKKQLLSLFNDKVKGLMETLLVMDGNSEKEVCFEDFLWANSVFWTRAMNIPLPHSFVFPQIVDDNNSFTCNDDISIGELNLKANEKGFKANGDDHQVNGESLTSVHGKTVWVEGIIPGIDFCNHDVKAVATWEVDQTGSTAGIPFSMYLLSAEESPFQTEKEITISYGNKGNEELLYLYGFVIDNNPDDYLMVHYPVEALQNIPFSDSKIQLLEAQKAELRCLLPKSLLSHGFFPFATSKTDGESNRKEGHCCNYSWSGQRKIPSYLNKLVFPEELLTTLRTVAMQEDELYKVSSLLEELVGCTGEQQPAEAEIRAAVWEACGDSGALQLLVDLLQTKMMDLEENSATTEDSDTKLLEKDQICKTVDHGRREEENNSSDASDTIQVKSMSRNMWSSIIYRRAQKQLTRLFLKEAEYALELCLSEGN